MSFSFFLFSLFRAQMEKKEKNLSDDAPPRARERQHEQVESDERDRELRLLGPRVALDDGDAGDLPRQAPGDAAADGAQQQGKHEARARDQAGPHRARAAPDQRNDQGEPHRGARLAERYGVDEHEAAREADGDGGLEEELELRRGERERREGEEREPKEGKKTVPFLLLFLRFEGMRGAGRVDRDEARARERRKRQRRRRKRLLRRRFLLRLCLRRRRLHCRLLLLLLARLRDRLQERAQIVDRRRARRLEDLGESKGGAAPAPADAGSGGSCAAAARHRRRGRKVGIGSSAAFARDTFRSSRRL